MKNHKVHFQKWLGGMLLILFAISGCVTPEAKITTSPSATIKPTVGATSSIQPLTPSPKTTTAAAVQNTPLPTTTPIPLCTFANDVHSNIAPVTLSDYVVSAPQVVLTHTSAICVLEWLPDNQNLLITRLAPNSVDEYVDTLDVQSQKLQSYGSHYGFSVGLHNPIWLTARQAVAYTDIVNEQWALRIHYGTSRAPEEIIVGANPLYLATNRQGAQIFFFPDPQVGQLEVFDTARIQRTALDLLLPLQLPSTLPTLPQLSRVEPYQITWHPDEKQGAFYNNVGLYMVDLVTQNMCEVDLNLHSPGKRWAVDVQWSADGRYLAALTTAGEAPVDMIDLAIIDMTTGEVRHLNFGYQYLSAMTWAPDSYTLLLLADSYTDAVSKENYYDLLLVDAVTGEMRQLWADYPFIFSGVYGSAWSATGDMIALTCPTVNEQGNIAEGRVCLLEVEVKP